MNCICCNRIPKSLRLKGNPLDFPEIFLETSAGFICPDCIHEVADWFFNEFRNKEAYKGLIVEAANTVRQVRAALEP